MIPAEKWADDFVGTNDSVISLIRQIQADALRWAAEECPEKVMLRANQLDPQPPVRLADSEVMSSCCNAVLTVVSSDEGTNHYRCSWCQEPADPKPRPRVRP